MAAETKSLESAITEAKSVKGLTVNVNKKTIKVKESQYASELAKAKEAEKEEEAKLRAAIKKQKENIADYEAKASDINYLFSNFKSNTYTKEQIMDLLNDYENTYFLNLSGAESIDVSTAALTEAEINELVENGAVLHHETSLFRMEEGMTVIWKNCPHIKTDGLYDVKITLSDFCNNASGKNPLQSIYVGKNGLHQVGSITSYKWKIEIYKDGINQKGNFLFELSDIDGPAGGIGSTYSQRAEQIILHTGNDGYKLPDGITSDLQITDNGNVITGTYLNNNPEDGDNCRTDTDLARVLYIKNDTDNITLTWGGWDFSTNDYYIGNKKFANECYLGWNAPTFTLNEPVLEKTSISVTEYDVQIVKSEQKAKFNFVDKNGKSVSTAISKTGKDNETIPVTDVNAKIKELQANGYKIVTNPVTSSLKYDEVDDSVQEFNIVLEPIIETIKPDNPKMKGTDTSCDNVKYPSGVSESDLNKTIKRTIKYVDSEGNEMSKEVTQSIKLTRTATFNYVTGEVKYSSWSTGEFKEVKTPEIDDYVYDKSVVEALDVTSATKNTQETVTYSKIPQKGVVKFLDGDTPVADEVELNGFNGEPIEYSPADTIKELESKGYDVVDNDFPENPEYDRDSDKDQIFTVSLKPHIEKITSESPKSKGDKTGREGVTYPEGLTEEDLTKTFTRTIYYKYADGSKAAEPVVQEVTLTREAEFNYVTGEVTYGEWSTDKFEGLTSPEIAGYRADILSIDEVEISEDSTPEDITVTYTKTSEEVKEAPVVNTSSPSSPQKVIEAPDTGDTKATPFIITALVGAGGLIASIFGIRKRRKNN